MKCFTTKAQRGKTGTHKVDYRSRPSLRWLSLSFTGSDLVGGFLDFWIFRICVDLFVCCSSSSVFIYFTCVGSGPRPRVRHHDVLHRACLRACWLSTRSKQRTSTQTHRAARCMLACSHAAWVRLPPLRHGKSGRLVSRQTDVVSAPYCDCQFVEEPCRGTVNHADSCKQKIFNRHEPTTGSFSSLFSL